MRHPQLRAFHFVAQTGGFSRAAEAMNLSQPAVSDQVGQLERDHDVLLFDRSRRQVSLTEAGKRLYTLTRQYFELEERMSEALSVSRTAVAGQLRLVVDAVQHVNVVLSRFREKHPKVTVQLTVANSEIVQQELRAYRADIGVIGTPADKRDFDTIPLGASPIVAFAEKEFARRLDTPVTLAGLAGLPFVSREAGSQTRQMLEAEMARQGLRLAPSIVAQGREAVKDIVAAGAGVGAVSLAELGQDDRLVALPIVDCDIEMTETLICLARRSDVPAIRSFMAVARDMSG